MPIESWFSTPLFVYDFADEQLHAIQREIDTNISNIRQNMYDSPWGDSVKTTFEFNKTNDIEKYNLTKFKSAINWALNSYVTSINYRGPEFTLEESWFNFSSKNGFQYEHTHAGNRVSGTYYYATNGDDGAIRFSNPNIHMQFNGFPSDGAPAESISYRPKIGRLILFPSWLTHRVNVNNTDSERISIAVNFK